MKRTEPRLADWLNSRSCTLLQKIFEESNNSKTISLALGFPDPKLFPLTEYQKALHTLIIKDAGILQYAPPSYALKKKIVKIMALRQVICDESQILLTSGAQQAINILTKLFLNKNDTIISESHTYTGFLDAVSSYTPNFLSFSNTLKDGLNIDSLEYILKNQKKNPSLIYIISAGNNPLGISLNEASKKTLVDLCCFYNIPIIEDDCYGFLNYSNTFSKPLKSYKNNQVFYVGTFSKILAPSLRVGWIVAPKEYIPKLSFIKDSMDINTVTLGQHVTNEILNNIILENHVELFQTTYKQRRDIMIDAIKEYFPTCIHFSEPTHGFFVWVELPPPLKVLEIYEEALKEHITFVPSQAFAIDPNDSTIQGLRLSFSYCEPHLIKKGISILGEIIKRALINLKVLE